MKNTMASEQKKVQTNVVQVCCAVFTFSSICSIRKVYVTPMPDTSSLKSIILKIPFALGHIPTNLCLAFLSFVYAFFNKILPKVHST